MEIGMGYVRNGWYVAGLSSSVTQQPIKRVMLEESIVLYRTEAGVTVALSDRCPHRFAPLHKGKVKGDCIECPYHGLQFAPTGACALNPHGDHKVPRAAKVKAYPVVERDGMGDPGLADTNAIVDLTNFLGGGQMTVLEGDYVLHGHYELVLDNLLDLSHAAYLHPTTLGNPESIAKLRFEMKQDGDTVWAYHYVPDSPPSEQFRPFRQSTTQNCDSHAHMRWDPPCNLQLDVGINELGQTAEEGLYLHFAHLLTPIDMNQTRYTWLAARNFLIGNDEVSKGMHAQIHHAFTQEDEPIISDIAINMGTPDLFSLSPVLLPGDAAGVRARRILKMLREREADAN